MWVTTRGGPGGGDRLGCGSNCRGRLILLLPLLLAAPQSLADDHTAMTEVCAALQTATVRIVSGADLSSGVVVTAEGHILTVAHGLRKNANSVTIVFSDGESLAADLVLRDATNDVAVLKIVPTNDARTFSPIPINSRSEPQKGQLVLAAGYPGRERTGLPAVIRIGELLAAERQVLRSSCALTAGDSGGPLCNHRGELIGVHRQIGLGKESNLHIPVDRIRHVIAVIPELSQIMAARHVEKNSTVALPVPSAEALEACRLRTVEISTAPDEETSIILGTLLDSLHVATKLSELAPNATIVCRFHSGEKSRATVEHSDVAMDLAILKLAQSTRVVTELPKDFDKATAESGSVVGRIVFAPTGLSSVSCAGIVTREASAEPPMAGKLGAILEVTDPSAGVRVTDVAPNSTAAKAGLAVRDRINTINAFRITTLDDIAGAMKLSQPGDWLRIELQRENEQRSAYARLQHDPGERFERAEFLDGRSGRVSERRSGFKKVLQHDIPLAPHECGGPLCDASGRIIGINIARRARESTLAIPIGTVLQASRNSSQSPGK